MTIFQSITQWWPRRIRGASLLTQSDDSLLERYQAGRASHTLDIVVSRHADALYHFLVTLSDTTLAQDISQHVWLKLIEKPERFQPGKAQFRTWLFTVARNAVIDELRTQQRWQWQPLDEIEEATLPDWNADIEFSHQHAIEKLFDQALAALPFSQKEALMLQLEGFSLKEIADITNEKEETIKSRLRFARRSLKQRLEVTHG